MIIDGEDVRVIYPERIIIIYDTDKSYYKLGDMTLKGIFKSMVSIFIPHYKLCN